MSLDQNQLAQQAQDEHFELFCLAMERGFALHTGSSNHLIVNYRLGDTERKRHLPVIHPQGNANYRLPEKMLKPSDLFLYFDPAGESDIPQLAHYCANRAEFVTFKLDAAMSANHLHKPPPLPVAKLSSLKGLHYLKDIACLQLYELDFECLFDADPLVAEHIRSALLEKLQSFAEFSRSWQRASNYEQSAMDYLAELPPVAPQWDSKPPRGRR